MGGNRVEILHDPGRVSVHLAYGRRRLSIYQAPIGNLRDRHDPKSFCSLVRPSTRCIQSSTMRDSCYPFNQLMVQSLGLINSNLKLSWEDKKKDTFDYSRGKSSISNSRLLPPSIRITPEKIFYVVKFDRGLAKAPSFIPESEFDLQGWELAIPCEPGQNYRSASVPR